MSKDELIKKFSKLRNDFPILNQKINSKSLVYLDNAATSQKPQAMIDKLVEYYSEYNSNVHRGIHSLSEKATIEFEKVRDKVANFINSKREEIVFTAGTTDSINMLANMLEPMLETGDEIILTPYEHHANLVPWQELARRKGLKLKFLELDDNFFLDIEDLKSKLNKETKIVAISHISNVLGSINNVKEISRLIQENRSTLIVDCAQSMPHIKVDVRDLDADFITFSPHKMCGPTGLGILYGKLDYLKRLNPSKFGGSMISDVELYKSTYSDIPQRFETGTPNIADIIAFGSSIDYINSVGIYDIEKYDKILTEHFLSRCEEIKDFKLIGSLNPDKRISVFSFTLGKVHPTDLAHLLDLRGIAIRTGHHCAIPLNKKFGLSSTARASFYFYNTIEEVDYLIDSLKDISRKFNK